MVTEETIDLYRESFKEDEGGFPKFFVSQPPHRDNLSPVYYKIVAPDGPVFWRKEGDDVGRKTSMYDMFLEATAGYGLNQISKEYTPWG